ncbi:hypothetical protein K3495_g6551 [Podosphaera aphanis]|nr:hypothetical protein K3495_g6551 [Podosphaera aphanis]
MHIRKKEHPELQTRRWMVSDKKIQVTWAVGRAWQEFSRDQCQLIRRSFKNCGISLLPDVSEDNQQLIKDLTPNFEDIGQAVDLEIPGQISENVKVSDEIVIDFENLKIVSKLPLQTASRRSISGRNFCE